MNWGSGFITQIIYATAGSLFPPNGFLLMDGEDLLLMDTTFLLLMAL